MSPKEKEQIQLIIDNFTTQYKHVPFMDELATHQVFGPLFADRTQKEKDAIQGIINEYIDDKIQQFKTKWGELFRRFYHVNQQLFRKFRNYNVSIQSTKDSEFQILGKQVEQELFKYEGILTEKMLNRPEWLDKTLAAFYDIIYMFFPYYNSIS